MKQENDPNKNSVKHQFKNDNCWSLNGTYKVSWYLTQAQKLIINLVPRRSVRRVSDKGSETIRGVEKESIQ